jgi:predicted HicB family RNase H-like nuclease
MSRKEYATLWRPRAEHEERFRYLNYKGKYGTVEYSIEDQVFCGKLHGAVLGLHSYKGNTFGELVKAFEESVDLYFEEFNNKK